MAVRHFHFEQALMPSGWAGDVRLSVDGGLIIDALFGAAPVPSGSAAEICKTRNPRTKFTWKGGLSGSRKYRTPWTLRPVLRSSESSIAVTSGWDLSSWLSTP